MNVYIDKSRIEHIELGTLSQDKEQALDYLWQQPWVKMAISKSDRQILDGVKDLADELACRSDIVVIAASGPVANMIKAVTAALQPAEDRPEVIVFGESLSAWDYSRLMDRLDGRDFALAGIAAGEETPEETAAFVTLKRFLIEKYGQEKAADRICAVAGEQSRVLAPAESEDAAITDYPVISFPKGVGAAEGANTAAVLLPMAIMGLDPEPYLKGFEEMLASPGWDVDCADYAMARTLEHRENILTWQRELAAFGRWAAASDDRRSKKCLFMPGDKDLADRGAEDSCFETVILTGRERADVMTPFFEGCNDDGSLNLLLMDKADEDFAEGKGKRLGVKILIEELDEYNMGQLFAFVQLSNGITKYLLKD